MPLYLAAIALLLDLFVLARPKAALSRAIANWPFQMFSVILFLVTIVVVDFSSRYHIANKHWISFFAGFLLIPISLALFISTFEGWKPAKKAVNKFAIWLKSLAGSEHKIHLTAVFIAAIGMVAEVAIRRLTGE